RQVTLIYDISNCFGTLNEVVDKGVDVIKVDIASSNNRDVSIVNSIKAIISENYKEEEFSVNAIADKLYYTSAYVCMVFKKITGITINDYINHYRLSKAKKLLLNMELKLYDIARLVGYSNDNYFSKVFKKYEGMTPSEFRRELLLNEIK
ncbi:MAG: helix-turn-helix transcriptional regulator, partial [Clostridiaceae bacterium]|nr:helix-turn-helix transcriptional regulator [Clostridiaceae bacterium]